MPGHVPTDTDIARIKRAVGDVATVHAAVLDWYAANGRDLAFRRTTDAWAILVSEVMAQQTQAERAAEAWQRFMAEFPTVSAVAAASPAMVIRAWRGLGYNRRAIALRAAAIEIVEQHGGDVPDDLETLLHLPGIGPYTARAVLAIAFGQPVAALDVNIRRVLGRALLEPAVPARQLQADADQLVPTERAAEWTHALMDLGAAFCRPRDPRCDECPLRATCRYAQAHRAIAESPPARSPSKRGTLRKPPTPFPATTRWLRGRIMDRLRDAPDGAWTTFHGGIGAHDANAVRTALARLSSEGMIELDGGRARLEAGA